LNRSNSIFGCRRIPSPGSSRRRAFSLIEVLILVAVIAVIGAAAGRVLQTVASTPVKNDQAFQIETQLISKMETLRALASSNYAALDPSTATSLYSDTFTISGTTYQRTVTVAYLDATSMNTSTSASGPSDSATPPLTHPYCKHITVSCAGQSLSDFITEGG
jgi:type II secretory pathway pseudopilin PulG